MLIIYFSLYIYYKEKQQRRSIITGVLIVILICTASLASLSITKYYILALIQMIISAFAVSLIYNQIRKDEVVIKMLVDLALFFCSFQIQRDWVFKLKQ